VATGPNPPFQRVVDEAAAGKIELETGALSVKASRLG